MQAKAEDVVSNPFTFQVAQQDGKSAQIGISIEPLAALAQQTPISNSTPSTLNSFLQYTQKMLENFVNFSMSFAVTQSQMQPNPSETFVPMSTVEKWYKNFERKMSANPNFWKKL